MQLIVLEVLVAFGLTAGALVGLVIADLYTARRRRLRFQAVKSRAGRAEGPVAIALLLFSYATGHFTHH